MLTIISVFAGLIGIILAMSLLLHRVNIRARQQRQIQDHLETIHAILGKQYKKLTVENCLKSCGLHIQ